MPMTPFIQRFPELGTRETRTLTTAGLQGLPADEYAFLEMYCDETDCDCRRVVIEVIARRTGETLAIINFGWENLEFYEKKLLPRDQEQEQEQEQEPAAPLSQS